MVAFLRLFKRRFGGLKKFILTHPDNFDCGGEEHNFNPMVSVIHQPTMSAMFQGDEVEVEVEEEEYGYGGAVSKSGLPRPRQQGYPPHRDDAGYNPAPGLGPPHSRIPIDDDYGEIDDVSHRSFGFGSSSAHDQHGPSYKNHPSEGDLRRSVDTYSTAHPPVRYGHQQISPYGQDSINAPSMRYVQQQQQQQPRWDNDQDHHIPSRRYQSYDRGNENRSSRQHQPPQQQSYLYPYDHNNNGDASARRYQLQPHGQQQPQTRQLSDQQIASGSVSSRHIWH